MQVARHWRTRHQRYGLVGEVCDTCGNKIFPPRDICPDCDAPAKTPFAFSGLGEIYSYSTVYHAPEGYDENVPYSVALVKLEEGPLVTAQLTDVEPEELSVGMPVEMVTRKIRQEGKRGILIYAYKFRPRLAAGMA
jgi:uncharacterized OB-fold protein